MLYIVYAYYVSTFAKCSPFLSVFADIIKRSENKQSVCIYLEIRAYNGQGGGGHGGYAKL